MNITIDNKDKKSSPVSHDTPDMVGMDNNKMHEA